jgi:hypothetical protein
MMLVSEVEILSYLGYDDDVPFLDLIIKGVSSSIISYLGAGATFLSANGELILDSAGNPIVPNDVKLAVAVWVAERLKNREGQPEVTIDSRHGYGYPPPAVVSLIGYMRTPGLA